MIRMSRLGYEMKSQYSPKKYVQKQQHSNKTCLGRATGRGRVLESSWRGEHKADQEGRGSYVMLRNLLSHLHIWETIKNFKRETT